MVLETWVNNRDLADWVLDATDRLVGTVADFDLDDARWVGPYLPVVNPPIWELAHVAWFAEWFVLRQLHGRQPLIEHADERFDSALVAHKTRWQLNFPDSARTIDYVRQVADSLIDVLHNEGGLDSTPNYVAYAVMHHDAHCEALTYTRQTLDWGPLPGADASPAVQGEPISGDRRVNGGRILVGASRRQPFVMDNEKWAHPVNLDSFDLAVAPVTVSQFGQFADDGGFSNDSLWSPQGLAWRNETAVETPNYWRHSNDGWERRMGSTWRSIADSADHPMVHTSWWEAEAWCNWAGRRLPTEAEWEAAATTSPAGARLPWFPWGGRNPKPEEAALDGRTGGTVPVGSCGAGDGPWGHRQLIGNVWEWTSTTFGPYPHFEPDAYRDNSEPWFGTRKVLRGGSWATRNRYVRSTYRNYFTPDRRDVYAGFRTCPR